MNMKFLELDVFEHLISNDIESLQVLVLALDVKVVDVDLKSFAEEGFREGTTLVGGAIEIFMHLH